MSLLSLLPALTLVIGAVGLSAVAASATTTPVPLDATTTIVAGTSMPAAIDGFAAGVVVSPRLACGRVLATLRTGDDGVLRLPPDLFAHTASGRYRLLVSGPSSATATTDGNVVVTVPRTEIVGVRVDTAHRAQRDPGVPVPVC